LGSDLLAKDSSAAVLAFVLMVSPPVSRPEPLIEVLAGDRERG
jgi:hypothetical protein